MTLIIKKYSLKRTKMPELLDGIEKDVDASAITLYIPPGFSEQEIEGLLRNGGLESFPEDLAQLSADSKIGSAIFWGESRKYLVIPPFPVKEKAVYTGFNPGPLRQIINSDYKTGLVLVHLGSYAVGFCRGETIVSSKVGTGLIHGRHKKGGSSQQRFQRRRQKQVEEFLDRVCVRAGEQLQPQAGNLDYLVYGGPRQTVLLLKKRCQFLKSLEEKEMPLVNVPTLRQTVLEKTISRIWSSSIIEWQDD